MERIFFKEADDIIDIRHDSVFKAVFTRNSPASKGALSRLVSALIGRELAIVTITANEPPVDNLRERQIRFDISCRTENDELVNVEMSLNSAPYEPIRLEYYASRLFTSQGIRGTDYIYDDLKHAYQITILATGRFFPDDDFFHSFEYYDPERLVPLNGRTRIISLELSKLERVVEKPVCEMSKSEQWAVFFEYLTDMEKRSRINEIVALEEGIAMASSVLVKVSKDEEERARILRQEKTEMDWASYMAEAEEKGEQKIIELLKSGKSPDEIIKEYANR